MSTEALNGVHFTSDHETVAGESYPQDLLGKVIVRGIASVHERQWPGDIYEQCEALLAPDVLAAERQKLAQEESDPDFEERHTAGMMLGFMEALPQSLQMRTTDLRVGALMAGVKASPRLAERMFIPAHVLPKYGDDQRVISIQKMRRDSPLTLPLDNFVYATDFVDWEKGQGLGVVKTEDDGTNDYIRRTSTETIAAYGQRTTEAPPIEGVAGYAQPNGVVLFATVQGAHRTAAAIKRGDPTIKTKHLTLMPLGENYLDIDKTIRP